MKMQVLRNVNLYAKPPEESYVMTAIQLEDLANERLKLYLWLSLNSTRMRKCESWNDLRSELFEFLYGTHLEPLLASDIINLDDMYYENGWRDDATSHWLLKLAYCRSNLAWRQFVNFELEWIRIRLSFLSSDEKQELFDNNLQGVSFPKRVTRRERINLNNSEFSPQLDLDLNYYKVPFEESPTLVRNRNHLLNKGFIYFDDSVLDIWISDQIAKRLSNEFQFCSSKLSEETENNRRLKFILTKLDLVQPTTQFKFSNDSFKVDVKSMDAVVSKYPLCMRFLHEELRTNHHLKYFGRMQYGLFLKGLGLSCEEAVNFWWAEFSQTTRGKARWKRYLYLFRHQYGQVGGRIDFQPYSCEKIQDQIVSPGGFYGCPFKHWEEEMLGEKLRKFGMSTQNGEWLKLKNEQKYSEACASCIKSKIISHPNEYFQVACCYSESLDNDILDIEDLYIS